MTTDEPVEGREVIRTWLRRHDYPADPTWQIDNLLSDLRAAGFEVRTPHDAARQLDYVVADALIQIRGRHDTWFHWNEGGLVAGGRWECRCGWVSEGVSPATNDEETTLAELHQAHVLVGLLRRHALMLSPPAAQPSGDAQS